jgi:HPt (histidine-containing phosphotransfer) domain-containing protein
MDMQMPELDGLGAARLLRADPRFASVPIIAMTANAMKADLDACLAAGMSDFVTKPIDRKALVTTLRRWLPSRTGAVPAPAPAPGSGPGEPSAPLASGAPSPAEDSAPPALPGFDLEGTVRRLGIDRPTLEPMLVRFGDALQQSLVALRAAVAGADAAAAARHAHAIAGSAGNFGADRLRKEAAALEQAGRNGRTDLAGLLAAVDEQAAVVATTLASLRPGSHDASARSDIAFDQSAAGPALDRLTEALEGFDVSSAADALAALDAAGMGAWAPQDSRELRRHVDGYEYAEALAVVARLRGRVQGVGA